MSSNVFAAARTRCIFDAFCPSYCVCASQYVVSESVRVSSFVHPKACVVIACFRLKRDQSLVCIRRRFVAIYSLRSFVSLRRPPWFPKVSAWFRFTVRAVPRGVVPWFRCKCLLSGAFLLSAQCCARACARPQVCLPCPL